MTATRAAAAVERALDERHREASEEVERILAAAPGDALTEAEWIGLMERLGGDS